MDRNLRKTAAAGIVALAIAAVGCGSQDDQEATAPTGPAPTESSVPTQQPSPTITHDQLDRLATDGDIFMAATAAELFNYSTDVVVGTVLDIQPGRFVTDPGEDDDGIYSTAVVRISATSTIKGAGDDEVLVEVAVLSFEDQRGQVTEDLAALMGATVLVAAGESTESFEPVTSIDGVEGRYLNALPQGFLVQQDDGSVLTLQFEGTYLTDLNGITKLDEVVQQAADDDPPTWKFPDSDHDHD